jgi:hypothetical protein
MNEQTKELPNGQSRVCFNLWNNQVDDSEEGRQLTSQLNLSIFQCKQIKSDLLFDLPVY